MMAKARLPVIKKDPSKGGAPLKLDDKKVEDILGMLRLGSYMHVAAAVAGLSYSTLKYWIAAGKADPKGPYADLLHKIREALGQSEVRDLQLIDMAAHGRPAKYLEEPKEDKDGNIVKDAKGNPIMVPVRDAKGDLVVVQSEVKPDWKAAITKLERRSPARWGKVDRLLVDDLSKVEDERDVSGNADGKTATPMKDAKQKLHSVLKKLHESDDVDDL